MQFTSQKHLLNSAVLALQFKLSSSSPVHQISCTDPLFVLLSWSIWSIDIVQRADQYKSSVPTLYSPTSMLNQSVLQPSTTRLQTSKKIKFPFLFAQHGNFWAKIDKVKNIFILFRDGIKAEKGKMSARSAVITSTLQTPLGYKMSRESTANESYKKKFQELKSQNKKPGKKIRIL